MRWRSPVQEARPAPEPAEKRQQPFTDAIVRQILADRTEPDSLDAHDTAALEAAAGVVARAFASAQCSIAGVETNRFTPALLASVGRDLIIVGEALVVDAGAAFARCTSWDVSGQSADEANWSYRAQLPVPDGHRTVMRSGSEVAHPRYSADSVTPWHGVGPMARATAAARLAGGMELRAGEEASAAVGYLLPIPTGADEANVADLKAGLKKLAGGAAVVETTTGGWGEGRAAAPQADWKPQRIGADWPASAPTVYRASQLSVLAACGVPIELIERADGTGQREAWRRCLHSTIEPLGRIVAYELGMLVGAPVTLSFERLFASDIQGRARAFQSMVGGGMDVAAAAAASGLLDME